MLKTKCSELHNEAQCTIDFVLDNEACHKTVVGFVTSLIIQDKIQYTVYIRSKCMYCMNTIVRWKANAAKPQLYYIYSRLTDWQNKQGPLTHLRGAVDHITWSSFHMILSLKVEFDSLETAVSISFCSTVRLREVWLSKPQSVMK